MYSLSKGHYYTEHDDMKNYIAGSGHGRLATVSQSSLGLKVNRIADLDQNYFVLRVEIPTLYLVRDLD